MTPEELANVGFRKSPLGRRGYDEREVDTFVDRLRSEYLTLQGRYVRMSRTQLWEDSRSDLVDENAELAEQVRRLRLELELERGTDDEVSQLRRELAEAKQENARLIAESEKDLRGISDRAVHLMSKAQLSADATVEAAERHARELVLDARDQYRDILRRARKSAQHATDELAAAPVPVPVDGRPVPEIEYVRTYTRIARLQLRSVVDALSAEIDKLADLPRLPSGEVPALRSGISDQTALEAIDGVVQRRSESA
ncbi:DivIVA domain-containing protein [Skermania piniformis]